MSLLSSAIGFFNGSYTFEVQETCKKLGVDLNKGCKINFHDNNTVLSYGTERRGDVPSSGDIAGLGVWLGLSSGWILCIVALFHVVAELNGRWAVAKRGGRFVRYFANAPGEPPNQILRGLLIAVADSLLVITVSFGISFAVQGRCTVTAYHYNAGIDLILLSCASQVLSIVVVRDYWSTKTASAVRTLFSCFIFAVLGRFLYYQFQRPKAPEYMTRFVSERTDSALLMPMACFLDPDLDPFKGLSPLRVDNVGGFRKSSESPEWPFYIILIVCFALGQIAHGVRGLRGSHKRPAARHSRCFGFMVGAYWVLSILSCSIIYIWCWIHMWTLRDWANNSGWLTDRGEVYLGSMGQIIPIATFFWVLVQVAQLRSVARAQKEADSDHNGHYGVGHAA